MVRGIGEFGKIGGLYCLSSWRGGCSSKRVRGRPRLRFSSGTTDSGVDTDLGAGEEEDGICWRCCFLTPFVLCLTGERNFVFWTRAARALFLNAVGAVAGAGVSRILGVCVDVHFFGTDCCDRAGGVDGRIDGIGKDDDRAVVGKNTCGLSMVVELESRPM